MPTDCRNMLLAEWQKAAEPWNNGADKELSERDSKDFSCTMTGWGMWTRARRAGGYIWGTIIFNAMQNIQWQRKKLHFNATEDNSDSNKGQMRRSCRKLLRQMLTWWLLSTSCMTEQKKKKKKETEHIFLIWKVSWTGPKLELTVRMKNKTLAVIFKILMSAGQAQLNGCI